MSWGNNIILGCLALFSLSTLFLFYVTPTPESHLEIDSAGYERTATYFAQTSRIVDPATPSCHPVQTLAYPFFVGMIYKIFGHSYGFVVLMQLILAMVCGLLIYHAAVLIGGEQAGLYVLVLWSINLGFLVYVQFLLTEILLVTFLLGFIERFVLFLCTKKKSALFTALLMLGVSVVVKPAALLFIFPLAFLLLFFVSGAWWARIKIASLGVLCFLLPVVGYMTSNKIRFGHFSIAPMTNEILYRYFSAKVKAKLEGKNYEKVLEQEQWCTENDLLNDNGWQKSKKFLINAAYQHPLVVLHIWFTNVVKTWFGLFTTQLKVLLDPAIRGGDCSFFKVEGTTFIARLWNYITFGDSVWLKIIAGLEFLWTMLRYFLLLFALWIFFLREKYSLLAFCITYFFYFTLITGHDGCGRYRMMVEPLILILVAVAVQDLLKKCTILRVDDR
jgi:hypothetical protein